ncbi:hypothetical protein EV126DRAFT_76024 [Verticillium dahliae]|nr:hypothetical protein EV126DRAFT_76024 [Verticillium dahliae]
MVHADAGPVAAPFLPSLFPSGAPPSPNAPSLSIPCVPPTHTHHGHGRGHGHSSAPLASALFSSLIPPLPSPSRLSHSYPPSTPPPSKIIKPQSVLHFSNPFEISFPQDFSFPLSRFSSPPLSFPLPLRRSPPPSSEPHTPPPVSIPSHQELTPRSSAEPRQRLRHDPSHVSSIIADPADDPTTTRAHSQKAVSRSISTIPES